MTKYHRTVTLALALTLLACNNAQSTGSQAFANVDTRATDQNAAIPLEGRVTDSAHILSPGFRIKLSGKLERFERLTHHQMVVVTVTSLGGRDIADFTLDLFNAWGIGRKGYNDGVVILVAPNERKVRIAVGFGLEKTLTGPVCQEIIDTAMLPSFQAGDFAQGIELGTNLLIDRLN